ncbi:hypothetical protein M9435_001374 [Picochlorum sp. BPE23]|nr:hypothetical protein M9435_001374 [Picochlorum sp. BPE23]
MLAVSLEGVQSLGPTSAVSIVDASLLEERNIHYESNNRRDGLWKPLVGQRDMRWPILLEQVSQTKRHYGTQSSGSTGLVEDFRRYITPYMQLSRIEKPIGTWLLAWPCFWSIGLAAPHGGPIDVYTLGLFGMGAILLRGSGCTVNDMWDSDFDKKVERTASRPLAAGTVTHGQALAWLGLQLSAGLGILLQLNETSQLLGVASLPFVIAYPLMKRITGWPQAFLGLTINWGAFMGWAAVHGSCSWDIVGPLYASGVFWTLVYDTIYAHQDTRDDVKAGVKSTALTFGERTKPMLWGFAACNIASMAAAGVMAECHGPFFIGMTAAAAQLAWQIQTVNLTNPEDCARKFKSNWWYGCSIFAGIVADKLLS